MGTINILTVYKDPISRPYPKRQDIRRGKVKTPISFVRKEPEKTDTSNYKGRKVEEIEVYTLCPPFSFEFFEWWYIRVLRVPRIDQREKGEYKVSEEYILQ